VRAVVRLLALTVAAILVGAALATPAKPRLRIAVEQPLLVVGTSFVSHERVRVEADGRFGTRSLRVRATAAGAFRVRFAKLRGDPCSLRSLTAVGAKGSRAVLRLPPGVCADLGQPPPG
jgi:hypothetical protein